MTSIKQNVTQNIKYNGNDAEYSADIIGENVFVHCNQGAHNHGSSKVKLINRIDYNWEFRYYHGHLVCAHINGKIFAYGMKGKDGGMVRVCNQETDKRALIKNLKEDVKDLSFAFSRQEIILGCVDSEGNVLIYQINDSPTEIKYSLLLHIYHRDMSNISKANINYRIIWCPYLSSFDDEDSGDDPEKMFVLLNESRAEVYNVGIMNSKYGVGPIDTNESYEGYIEINHTDDLIDASFSSDGTAIAIACLDGFVKFFQLYMVDAEKQKCLHEWKPHDGKPLSSIIFIDNVLEYSSECWKFTITGANNNSEIKLWSCETWTCLQTITFQPDPKSIISSLYLNMSIDYTGQYLVVSDINNRVLYVLQLDRNDAEQMVHVTTLSQFLLPGPFLSFHIVEAQTKKIPFSYSNSTEDLYGSDQDDFDEDTDITANFLKMLIVQPKKFQECNIMFQPDSMYKKSDCDTEQEVEKVPELDDLQSSVTLLIQQQTSKSQLNLMKPEDFTTTSTRPSSVRNSVSNESQTGSKSLDKLHESPVDELMEFQRLQKDNFASGGSSPSREVQEILSLNNSNYSSTHEYFDNLSKLSEEEQPQKEYNNQTETLNLTKPTTEVVWPKIPIVNESEIVKEGDIITELHVNSSDEDVNKSNLQAINFRISSLENTIREQSIHMQNLQKEMKTITQISRQNGNASKEGYIKELELIMSKQHLQIAKMHENLVAVQKTRERDMQEQIVNNVNQIMNKLLLEKVQNVLAAEIKPAIVPVIHNLIEQNRKQMDVQLSQRLSNVDLVLRDQVAKAINNKNLADTLSLSVVNIVAPSLEKCYRDIIYTTLLPSWEKVCSQMFQQINETFSKGTKEYTACVENYMDRQRRVQEKGKDIIVQMQSVSENMKSNSDRLSATLTAEIQKQFNVVFKSMHEKMAQSVREVVSEQVKQGFKSQASVIEDSVLNAVRSRAVTPAPHADTQATLAHIQQHIMRRNYDEAFRLALSAENLSYVIYTCEKVDVNILFGDECLLQQSCLLALIQQLSVELHKNTELKLSYIRAAFLGLSSDTPTTKQFVTKVLKELLKQLQIFISSNPPTNHLKEAKLLKMAAEGMITS